MKNVALQLYSVIADFNRDPYETLKRVAGIGYRYVEFAGYGGKDAKTLAGWLCELGLSAASVHLQLPNLDEEMEIMKALGAKNAAIPAAAMETYDQLAAFCQQAKEKGEKLKDAGMTLSYHNHNFEFQKHDGRYFLDILYDAVPPELLHPQLDYFWVAKGGADPVEYAKKYAGRAVSLHVKQMDKNGACCDVGSGVIDYGAVLALQKKDAVAIVELEATDDVWRDAEKSFTYLDNLNL